MDEVNANKITSNFIWRFAERTGAQLVAFVVSIILARLLDPSEYGTVALITIITTILQVFVDSGLGNALIQKKDADNIDFSTVFFTNVIFCLILYILLFLSAPLIAKFYDDTSITAYIRVLGLTVLISGLKNVQQAYVSRNMLFKKFFLSTLAGTLVAGVVGIIMAYGGFGVWTLVFQQVINLTIDTLILWITVKWRPEFVFSLSRLKSLFSYGWKLLVSSLLEAVYSNLSSLIIGKKYTSSDLAFYNQGDKFPKVIVANINSSIDSVLLPVMSNDQDNREKVKNMLRRSIKVSVYIMAPLMAGLAFCARSIVGLILTDKWLPCVFFLQVFCFVYMFYPIHSANLNAIKALGRSDLFLKLEIEKKIVGIIVLLSTMFINVKTMAIGLFFSSIISQLINASPNKKLLDYGYFDQLKDILPGVGLALIMGLLIYPVQFLGLSYFLTLLIQVPLGELIYLVGSKLLHLDSFDYMLGIVKSYSKRRK